MYHIYSESISRGLFRLGNIVQCPFKLGNICYYFLELLAHPDGFDLDLFALLITILIFYIAFIIDNPQVIVIC